MEIGFLTLKDSPYWTVHPYDCEDIHIHNIIVDAPQTSPNTDGFDPDSSRRVIIEDSQVSNGDDCVAVKSGWDCYGVGYGRASEDIFVRMYHALIHTHKGSLLDQR